MRLRGFLVRVVNHMLLCHMIMVEDSERVCVGLSVCADRKLLEVALDPASMVEAHAEKSGGDGDGRAESA